LGPVGPSHPICERVMTNYDEVDIANVDAGHRGGEKRQQVAVAWAAPIEPLETTRPDICIRKSRWQRAAIHERDVNYGIGPHRVELLDHSLRTPKFSKALVDDGDPKVLDCAQWTFCVGAREISSSRE
jgi:hypothetical protein